MEGKQSSTAAEASYFRRLLLAVGVVLAVGLLVTVVWLSLRVWLAVFAGVLLAIFFRTLGNWVSRFTRLPHIWALVLVLLALLGFAVLGGWLVAPKIASQFNEFGERLPKAIEKLEKRAAEHGWSRFLPEKLPPAAELTTGAGQILGKAASFFTVSAGAITTFFVILFLGIYLAATPELYLRGLLHLFPVSMRHRVRDVLDRMGTTLGHWLLGQMLSMAVVGTLIGLGLTLLGIPLGLAIGVLAGLLNFVPLVGSLISALPAVLLAFLVSPWHPLYVIALYVVVNSGIESHLLVPLIQRYAISLPPALSVTALFLMAELFGFLGLLLAIPLTATLFVLAKEVYVKDVLGDRSLGRG